MNIHEEITLIRSALIDFYKKCNNYRKHDIYSLFVCVDALCPSQQFISHVRTIFCLPGL